MGRKGHRQKGKKGEGRGGDEMVWERVGGEGRKRWEHSKFPCSGRNPHAVLVSAVDIRLQDGSDGPVNNIPEFQTDPQTKGSSEEMTL